jgi:hypothetical protein
VAVADVDGDGKPDAVVQGASHVYVLLGTGHFTFAAPVAYLASGSQAPVVTDLDGDGKPDIVTSGGTVLFNEGGGAFSAPVSAAPSPTLPTWTLNGVAVGDLNGDGKPDLAFEDADSVATFVVLNTGSRTFAAPVAVPSGGATIDILPAAIAVADLNGDGKPDLALSDGVNVNVFLNLGGATFGAPFNIQMGAAGWEGQTTFFAIADVNGDGKPDVVTQIQVFFNGGGGSFPSPVQFRPVGGVPPLVAVADMNGDGKPDLITTTGVILNEGNEVFGAPLPYDGTTPFPAVADMNGDGIPDLVTGALDGIEIQLGKGDGSVPGQDVYVDGKSSIDNNAGQESLRVADMNGDGRPDVVFMNSYPAVTSTGTLSVLLGQAGGGLGAPIGAVAAQATLGPVTDLDGDGLPDVVTYQGWGTGVSVMVSLGTGGGALSPGVAYPVPGPVSDVKVADLNGDGVPDLIVALSPYPSMTQSLSVSVLLGEGAGAFAPAVTYPVWTGTQPVYSGVSPLSTLVVADLNGDGKLDVAVDNSPASTVAVLLGTGSGQLAAPAAYDVGESPDALFTADLNGDGAPDLIAMGVGITVLLDQGDGTFGAGIPLAPGLVPYPGAPPQIQDLDGDGRPDLVFTAGPSGEAPNVLVVMNQGGGAFSAPVSYAVPITAAILLPMVDVDGDGVPDLIVEDAYQAALALLPSKGDGTFGPPAVYLTPDARILATANLEDDGRLDVIAVDTNGSSKNVGVTVLPGLCLN